MGGSTGEQPEDGHEERDADSASREAPAEDENGGKDAIDASLHLALSDLERMLDGREDEASPPATGAGRKAARHPESEGAGTDDDGEQYTIPLLDEVVIPGPSPVVPPAPGRGNTPAPLADDEPSVRARIAARIASEVEVIMQDRIEQALDRVREEIRERVRDHMDIILPEIVDELVQARRRRDGS